MHGDGSFCESTAVPVSWTIRWNNPFACLPLLFGFAWKITFGGFVRIELFDESALPLAPRADGCCESHEDQNNRATQFLA